EVSFPVPRASPANLTTCSVTVSRETDSRTTTNKLPDDPVPSNAGPALMPDAEQSRASSAAKRGPTQPLLHTSTSQVEPLVAPAPPVEIRNQEQELARLERLGQVRLETRLDGPRAILGPGEGGEGDGRHACHGVVAATHRADELVAVHVG